MLALLQAAEPGGLRAGLDTLYAGDFEVAAGHFATLAAAHPADAASLVFEAGAYIWWAAVRDRDDFARARVDSLLGLAIARAEAGGDEFWWATAHGYRARQRELHGESLAAARDARRMYEGYRRVLALDSTRSDCYLGLGLYEYGLARASPPARFVARVIGLGGGDAARGLRAIRRAARHGDLARVEATWVLAAALAREAKRDPRGAAVLLGEAREFVHGLARRYPANPVFARFLETVGARSPASRAGIDGPPGAS